MGLTKLIPIMVIMSCNATDRGRITPVPAATFIITMPGLSIFANGEQDVTSTARLAERITDARLARRPESERISPAALPFLSGTEQGQEFLARTGHRAIARGAPAEICPAIGLSPPSGADSRSAAVSAAIAQCFSSLRENNADERCGCEILAFDNIVAVRREDLIYSTGISARIRSDALRVDALLVADDVGDGETELRDLTTTVGTVRHFNDGRAELELADHPDVIFKGTSQPVGFRRGRIAEVLRLDDGQGREVLLTIGFPPQEFDALGENN